MLKQSHGHPTADSCLDENRRQDVYGEQHDRRGQVLKVVSAYVIGLMDLVLNVPGQAYTLDGMQQSADRMERRNSCIKEQKHHPCS